MLRRRLLWVLPLVLLLAAGAYTAWLTWQVKNDLTAAESAADRIRSDVEAGNTDNLDADLAQLQEDASAAADRTDGAWWGMLTHVPFLGDDAQAVEAMSSSLDTIATGGAKPLVDSVDALDEITADGAVRLDVVRELDEPVHEASTAFADAEEDLEGLDGEGYIRPLRSRYEDYAELVSDLAGGLESAALATEVLPPMLGGDGPRDYLLIFQNNAEIRSTGGMPGSWALLHADDGKLELRQQGTAGAFGGELPEPVLPLTPEELEFHGPEFGTYFQNAGFTPHFPRAAELWTARFEQTFPESPLDGVIALDPVAMSYLIDGTGPIDVSETTLTGDNLVEELLNRPYLELEPTAQDELFQGAARAIFDAATGDLADPVAFVEGLSKAAREGRLLVAAEDTQVADALSGTRVEGAMPSETGSTPDLYIGVNDNTGSKMSYYLRYRADVQATACEDERQTLSGTLSLNQQIAPSTASTLPVSVTGGGIHGIDPGDQAVTVKIFGPVGGTVESYALNGKRAEELNVVEIDGRPAIRLTPLLSSRDDDVITWTMTTAAGQTGDGRYSVTPSVVSGGKPGVFQGAC